MTTKTQQEHSIYGIISCKIRKRCGQKEVEHNLLFTQVCFQFSCGFAELNQSLQLKIPRTQCDWIDKARNQKNLNNPLWRVSQPWIHESECLSTIPFARNTEYNTWCTYNTRTSGRGHRPWRCRQRGN